MILWLDAHLPPSAAAWITALFGIKAHAVRDLGLRDAKDPPIFQAARAAAAVVMTKDSDFVEMLQRLGPPPMCSGFWTCGLYPSVNTARFAGNPRRTGSVS